MENAGLWTRRDSAHNNAVDTCREEGLQAGTDAWESYYREAYRSTLSMLIDCADMREYTSECEDCEGQPYPRKCKRCQTKERV